MYKSLVERVLQGMDKLYMADTAAMNQQSNPLAPNVNPITQASAASLANVISAYMTKISGTAAITGFRIPRGFRGTFTIIPTGAFTGVTGGALAYSSDGLTEDIPIGLAFTAVVGRTLSFTTDGLLCYPSYV